MTCLICIYYAELYDFRTEGDVFQRVVRLMQKE